MQWLAALCVRRPVFATVLILMLTVVGAFSFTQLGVDRLPKVDFPTVVVTTRNPGAAPEEIETEVTDKIEEAVNTVSGIDELHSTSAEGVSIVAVTFLLEKDVEVAAQEVRDRVNRVLSQLPRTVRQPTVEKMDPDASPIITLVLSAPRPIRDISEYADKVLRRQLESVPRAAGERRTRVAGGQCVRPDAERRLHAYQPGAASDQLPGRERRRRERPVLGERQRRPSAEVARDQLRRRVRPGRGRPRPARSRTSTPALRRACRRRSLNRCCATSPSTTRDSS